MSHVNGLVSVTWWLVSVNVSGIAFYRPIPLYWNAQFMLQVIPVLDVSIRVNVMPMSGESIHPVSLLQHISYIIHIEQYIHIYFLGFHYSV